MSISVLIVDDEIDIQSSLSFALKDEGYEVLTASSPAEAEKIIADTHIDIGLYDVWFPDGDGIELLKLTNEKHPDLSVVMMSGHGNIELALKSIRLGAYDFLEKPLELEKVLLVLKNAVESRQLKDENARLLETILKKGQIIGHSPSITSMKQELERESKLPTTVLICGEPGSGRELASRVLHQISTRRAKPFVTVVPSSSDPDQQRVQLFGGEKGALPDLQQRVVGALENAGVGSLYIDHLGAWSKDVFAEFLKALDEGFFYRFGSDKKVILDARLLIALSDHEARELNSDLLNSLKKIHVPALRDRREDTLELALYFAKDFAQPGDEKISFDESLKAWFLTYDWPGNVREMKNLIERMVISNPTQSEYNLDDLPEELQSSATNNDAKFLELLGESSISQGSLRDLRADFEKALIKKRLSENDGNVTKTAESLGIQRVHMHRKLKKYDLGAD